MLNEFWWRYILPKWWIYRHRVRQYVRCRWWAMAIRHPYGTLFTLWHGHNLKEMFEAVMKERDEDDALWVRREEWKWKNEPLIFPRRK